MMLQNDLSIQRSTGPDRQTIASVWFDNTVPILLFSQKVSSANSDMRRGSSACRSKFIIRNSHATAQNLKESLSGFFQFFTAQPVNIPVLIHFNLGILLIYYGGPIRILTVFDFAKFRQYTQQGISISIPFRAAGTIQHHQCTRPYLGTLRIGFRIDDSRHWRVITSSSVDEEITPFCFFYSNVSFPGVSTIFYILLDRNQHGADHSANKQIFTKFDM